MVLVQSLNHLLQQSGDILPPAKAIGLELQQKSKVTLVEIIEYVLAQMALKQLL